MQITRSLGQEIRSSIKNLLKKDVLVVDSEGICVSAPDEDLIGKNIDLPRELFLETETRAVNYAGESQLAIPLRLDTETVAALLVPGILEDMENSVPLLKSFAELLVQQYQVTNQPVLDSTDQFIAKVIHHATPAEIPFYESEATVLGYDLTVPRLAVVVHLKDFWNKCLASLDQHSFEREDIIKDWKRKIEDKLSGFFTQGTDNVVAYIGKDKFVIYKAVDGNEETVVNLLKKSHKAIFEPLKNFHIDTITVGFSNADSGVQGLIDAYREADLALEFGTRLWGSNKSYYFGDLGILSILGEGNREKEVAFANQLLGKLTNADLVETLECFFEENLNLTETARRMGIHRNTVIYRLNQIAHILDVDPRIFEQAMTIKIALLIKKLFG